MTEIPLQLETLQIWQPVYTGTVSREELSESIVPDTCPDVLSVLETECQVQLNKREPVEGRIDFSGSICSEILYRPEGAGSVAALTVNTPFQFLEEQPGVTRDSRVLASARVYSAEVRILNPRKLLLRIQLLVRVQVYSPCQLKLCSGMEAGEEQGMQLQQREWTGDLVTAVTEKEVAFSDTLSRGSSLPAAERILKGRALPVCGEPRLMGRKLMVKGSVEFQFLCISEGGELIPASFELPFSQILDLPGGEEEGTASVKVLLSSWEYHLSEDGYLIDVDVTLLAQATLCQTCAVQLLADAYSTRYSVELERSPLTCQRLLNQGRDVQNLRETVETGENWRFVCDAWATVGNLSQSTQGEERLLQCEVVVTLLGVGEEGRCTAVSRTFILSQSIPATGEDQVEFFCCPGQLQTDCIAGGVSLRLAVEFCYQIHRPESLPCVERVLLDEEGALETGNGPSIVLRQLSSGETLWQVAKAYATTCGDILAANGLEEESVPAGKFLLIPRRR